MKKLFVTLAALLFTSPAFAGLDHWTCSNETSVLYMALNTDEGNFVLWDDKGQFLAAAKFSDSAKTPAGNTMLYAILDSGVGVGVAKSGDNLILAITDAKGKAAGKFLCN